ncbi:MAG: phenylalanine--tRNA ligase subunit beta [Chloroflexota bacterium]|nr:phenylalanine--tRNA ligase subunit beta [Chloroflexota bacterium]
MQIPLSWLREYVDIDLPAHELAHRLTMAGVEVGEVTELGGWENCCVGQVMEVSPHPNADSLRLCRVNPGNDSEMEVVCGAPNVAAGQKICFARVGARLYNTHSERHETLKAARIRGVVSEGMICSELELGLGEGHEGIVVLPDDAPIGMALDDYLGDTILDLEVTPNRLDCFSVLGVAHEIGALTGKPVKVPEVRYQEDGPPITGQATVSVADPDLCPRYTASLIQGVKIGPSPQWLQDRLARAGLRPISNVVDVTNYVMLEFNQPLHAFDLDKVRDKTIIVRRAAPGEALETLDGVERELNTEVLVIADSRDPVGLGGVIGGANSEIGPSTTSVLLESATFNSYNNRRTADTFRLHTDASQRFEKGLRPELAPIALRRATQLIQEVAGGVIAQGIYDIYAGSEEPAPRVTLTLKRLKQILGMDVSVDQVEAVFQSLEFDTERVDETTVSVEPPYWRSDINIEEDLIEEVVRIIGYDNVPTTMLSTPIPYRQPAPMTELKARVKAALASVGLQETISYPLVSLEDLERVNCIAETSAPLRVANPMSAGHDHLRPTLLASLLGTLSYNEGHKEGPFRFFEQARVFLPRPNQLPDEREVAAGVISGLRSEPSWLVDNGPLDFFDVKGMLTSTLALLGLTPSWEPAAGEENPALHPGRAANIVCSGYKIGVLGELHPSIAERFDLRYRPATVFEIYLDDLLTLPAGSGRNFRSLTRFPSAHRDVALVVPEDVPAGKVQDILDRHRLVEKVELFDVYAGENLQPGMKSLAFHVYFQSSERTLTADEVNRTLDGLLRVLQREVGATLRD